MPRCGPTERPQFQVACAGGLPDSSPCMQRCNNISPLARRRMQYSAGRRVWPARGRRGMDCSSSRCYCLFDYHDHDWRWRLSRNTTWTVHRRPRCQPRWWRCQRRRGRREHATVGRKQSHQLFSSGHEPNPWRCWRWRLQARPYRSRKQCRNLGHCVRSLDLGQRQRCQHGLPG
jgi:hypothetical protein